MQERASVHVGHSSRTIKIPAYSNNSLIKTADEEANNFEDKTHPKMEVLLEANLSSAINTQTVSKPCDTTTSKYKYAIPISDENELTLTERKFDSDNITKDVLEQTPDLVEHHSRVIEKEKVREARDVSAEVGLDLVPKKAMEIPEEKLCASDIYEMMDFFASCNLAGLCCSSENSLNCGSRKKKSYFVPPREIYTPLDDIESIGELTELTWEYNVESRTSLRKSITNNSKTDESNSVVSDESSYAEMTLGDETVTSILRAKETLHKYASHLGVNTLLNGDEEATIATMATKDTINTQAEEIHDIKIHDHEWGK